MKTLQTVLVTLMCVAMVVLLAFPLVQQYVEIDIKLIGSEPENTQATTNPDATNPSVTEPEVTQAPEETDVPDSHNVKVAVSFEDGKMICRITQTCSCGEVTALKSASATKDAAMNLINAIGCDVFVLTQSEVELPITREELTQMVEGYAFAG